MREAKASYLDALSGLRAAEAEVQKSLAAINNGKAEWEKANAAYRMAEAKKQEIENEKEKAKADTLIAGAKKQAEIAAINYQKAMAEAQKALEETQKRIAAEALSLTKDEQKAINNAVWDLKSALSKYNDKVEAVETAKSNLFKAQNGKTTGTTGIDDELTAEEYKAAQNDSIADAKAEIANLQAKKEAINTNPDVQAWTAYVEGLKAEVAQNSYDSAKAVAAAAVLSQSLIVDAQKAAGDAWGEWYEENKVTLKPERVEYEAEMPKSLLPAMKTLMESFAQKVAGGNTWDWTWNANEDATDKFLNGDEESNDKWAKLGYKGVIETIEKSGLLEADTTIVKAAKAKYDKADSLYKAYADILKAGVQAFKDADTNYTNAVKDTVKKFEKFQADTAAYNTAKADSLAKYSADTAKVKALIAAREEMYRAFTALFANTKYHDIDNIGTEYYDQTYMDTLADAIVDFATKKEAVFGEQATDYIKYNKAVYDVNGTLKNIIPNDSIAVKNLTKDDFAQTVDSIKIENGVFSFKIRNQFCIESVIGELSGILGQISGYKYHSYVSSYKYTNTVDFDNTTYDTHKYVPFSELHSNIKNFLISNPVIMDHATHSTPAISGGANNIAQYAVVKALLALEMTESALTGIVLKSPVPRDEWFEFEVVDEKGEEYTVGLTEAGLTPAYIAQYPFGLWDMKEGSNYGLKSAFIPAASKAAFAAAKAKYKAAYDATKGSQKAFKDSKNTYEAKDDELTQSYANIKSTFFGGNTVPSALNDSTAVELQTKIIGIMKDYITYEPDVFYNGSPYNNANIEVIDEVIAQVAASTNEYFGTDDDVRHFVFGNHKSSQFAKTVLAEYEYNFKANSKDAKDYFAAVKTWVEGLEAELAEVAKANEEYNAAVAEFEAKAYGTYVDEDGKTVPYAPYFFEWFGGYSCNPYIEAPEAGQQKVIYDQYLKELVDQWGTAQKAIWNAAIRNNSIKNLLKFADKAAIKALEIANGEIDENDDFAKAVKELTGAIDEQIGVQNTKIANAEWELAQIAAGVDTKTLAIAKAERALEEAEAALAAAEAKLKVAQAQYDAVMAKYVK